MGQLVGVFQLADRTSLVGTSAGSWWTLLVGTETFALMLLLRLDCAADRGDGGRDQHRAGAGTAFLGAVPGLLLLLESPLQAAEFLIIILAVQQIDGNFIAPRILGGATGLSGLGCCWPSWWAGRLASPVW